MLNFQQFRKLFHLSKPLQNPHKCIQGGTYQPKLYKSSTILDLKHFFVLISKSFHDQSFLDILHDTQRFQSLALFGTVTVFEELNFQHDVVSIHFCVFRLDLTKVHSVLNH